MGTSEQALTLQVLPPLAVSNHGDGPMAYARDNSKGVSGNALLQELADVKNLLVSEFSDP